MWLNQTGIQRHRINERLKGGPRGAPRPRPIHLTGKARIVKIGRPHAGTDFASGGMEQKSGGIAQALRPPALEEIPDRLLHDLLLVYINRGGNGQ